jgi:pimeloyl-ACP methyl ester carboxylesterase
MTTPRDRYIQLPELRLHIREWAPTSPDHGRTFVLLHGLSSNARTWDQVAAALSAAGYPVFAVDQRGHGLSDKPADGYDFETITADLKALLEALSLENPVLAGQSWGGNVVLAFTARYPEIPAGLVFVDGGYINLRQLGPWEQVAEELRPPKLAGTPGSQIAARIGQMHPAWVPYGVEMTLGNFEHLPDGTVRPWLALENHLAILRALYDQDVTALYPQVRVPVLICAAGDNTKRTDRKLSNIALAEQSLVEVEVVWFPGAAHDIHVDRPGPLTETILSFIRARL